MSSRTLFWEEEVPGKTQLVAAISGTETIRTVTYYEIQVRVTSSMYDTGRTEVRTWSVSRRYREFEALHNVLHDLGFPCPSLPPKQLWGRHTNAFILDRQNALDCWIQGVVIIWQSVAPARAGVAYAIGELLEAFLCSPDSESFQKVLEEVQMVGKSAMATDIEPEIDVQLPSLDAPRFEAPLPDSPFVSHVAAADRGPRPGSLSSQPQNGTATSATTTFAQVAQNRRRIKRASQSNVILEHQASTFSDLPSLAKTDAPSSLGSEDMSKSAPFEDHAQPDFLAQSAPSTFVEWVPPVVPSAGAVGFAINMIASSSPTSQKQRVEYVTFNSQGQRVKHSFEPFTARVMFGEGVEGRAEVVRSSGMADACTPVSVPPTPHAQNQFNAQWNQYTSSVLEFVQERLSIVSRNKERRDFNILDRYYMGPPGDGNGGAMGGAAAVAPNGGGHVSDGDDDDANNKDHFHAPKTLVVINLREKGKPRKSDLGSELVEDADAGAGGSAQGGELPPKHALAHSYMLAGEHLVRTILKEAEADLVDWQFVSNTKDVVVMRRLRPIKKKNLLRVKGPSVQQPSPSPISLSDDRSRGNVALAPTMLALDGASSVASSVASSFVPASARDPSGALDVENSQHCFMGRGVIEAPAEEIFELVRRPEKRHFYDAMLNEELMLENLAVGEHAHDFVSSGIGNMLVYYHLFETNRCFLRYARDFCVVQYAKKVTVGRQTKYVVVGASINHAQCPAREDVERATLDLFGWVVEPSSKPKQSKVTYMMHIDFGRSGVPTHLLNTISFRQPLAVHYLRRHIQNMKPEERMERSTETTVSAASNRDAVAAETSGNNNGSNRQALKEQVAKEQVVQ